MSYVKISNPSNRNYDPTLIPEGRLETVLNSLHQHWVDAGSTCQECEGGDCIVVDQNLWPIGLMNLVSQALIG